MTTLRVEISVPAVEDLSVTDEDLIVELADGRTISVPLAWYPRLLHGSPQERSNWRLIADGEGVHWPDLDEDISAENLVAGRPSGESQQSLSRWLEQRANVSSASFPTHVWDPPMTKDDPLSQNAIFFAYHNDPAEQELLRDFSAFLQSSSEGTVLREQRMLDANRYLVIRIGVGIATSLVTDLIGHLGKSIRNELEGGGRPIIYIGPTYPPKRMFQLPEQENLAIEWFLRHPSKGIGSHAGDKPMQD